MGARSVFDAVVWRAGPITVTPTSTFARLGKAAVIPFYQTRWPALMLQAWTSHSSAADSWPLTCETAFTYQTKWSSRPFWRSRAIYVVHRAFKTALRAKRGVPYVERASARDRRWHDQSPLRQACRAGHHRFVLSAVVRGADLSEWVLLQAITSFCRKQSLNPIPVIAVPRLAQSMPLALAPNATDFNYCRAAHAGGWSTSRGHQVYRDDWPHEVLLALRWTGAQF